MQMRLNNGLPPFLRRPLPSTNPMRVCECVGSFVHGMRRRRDAAYRT